MADLNRETSIVDWRERENTAHGFVGCLQECGRDFIEVVLRQFVLFDRRLSRVVSGCPFRHCSITTLTSVPASESARMADDDDELCIYIPQQANSNVLRRGGRQPAIRRTGTPVDSKYIRCNVVGL